MARLGERLASGEAKLTFRDDEHKLGYLPSLLEQLGINPDSQVLVFSKTSFQQDLITPRTPRALYFNDDVTIGFVYDGVVLEVSANDPVQGVQFYSLDAHPAEKPNFVLRGAECASCHNGTNRGLSGLVIAATYTAADGRGFYLGTKSLFTATDHRTPLEDRWGGWYVTGTHGKQVHNGNAVAPDTDHPFDLDRSTSLNRTTLQDKIDTSRYYMPTSDLVALMTLEHQTRMTNLITRVGWDTRVAIHDGKLAEFDKRLDDEVDEIATYMLYADEAPLHDTVKGVSTFTKTFPERGPKDSKGRSLRDFDLHAKLFRYPMTYMIYSDAFDSLPDVARERIYHRLHDVLTGKDKGAKFEKLASADRQAVLEILQDTKPNLPAWWRQTATQGAGN